MTIKAGIYRVTSPGGEHQFDVQVFVDGSHVIHPKGSAECTVCHQGAGNDCVHFEAR